MENFVKLRPAIPFAAAALAIAAISPAGAAQNSTPLEVPQSAPSDLFSGERSPAVLSVQILLDRANHSPGVIDGMMGGNTRRAIKAYQRANGLPVNGSISESLLGHLTQGSSSDLLRQYKITDEDVSGPFRNVPSGFAAKADAKPVYESPAEALAEKFHMAQSFLRALNPGADFGRAGERILVVNAGSDRLDTEVSLIEVDKAANELRAYSSGGKLVATYPTTVGSSIHPSPNTQLEVVSVAPDPTYHFDPKNRSWGPEHQFTIAPGPNNPVGTVWIDLSRDGFGIHGTPEPKLIGKTSSHGCVRLTNWDANQLSKAVSKGTTVVFI